MMGLPTAGANTERGPDDQWFCGKCRNYFAEPIVHEVQEPYEFWGERGVQTFLMDTCPYCGDDSIEELEEVEDDG